MPTRGFTIVELLVAVGVTALLVTLMLNIVLNVLTGWNRTAGTLSTGNQARLILDQLSQDLQGAIFKADGRVWLAATMQDDQSSADDVGMTGKVISDWSAGKPAAGGLFSSTDPLNNSAWINDTSGTLALEDYRFGQAGVWLRFFTTPSDTGASATNASAPRAVAYELVRGQLGGTSGTQFSYLLFRSEAGPVNTFNAGFDILDAAYETGVGTSSVAGNIRRPHAGQIIGNNVVDFGVRLFRRNSSGALEEFFPVLRPEVGAATIPSSVPYSSYGTNGSGGSGNATYNGSTLATGFPVVAEVMLRILTPEGVRLVEAFEEDSSRFPASTWWSIVTANSNIYIRRIELKASAL